MVHRVSQILLLACLGSLRAPQAGMQNEWDFTKRMVPFVDQIHPEQWVSRNLNRDHSEIGLS
jgi:hypothetical protein